MPVGSSKFELLTLKRDVWDFLAVQYERLGSDLGHISTLWEIPGEDEKELLVEHIANCVSGEKTSVIETFHKIRARVLYVTREPSPTDLLDDYLLECILYIKFFVNQHGFISWRKDPPKKAEPWPFPPESSSPGLSSTASVNGLTSNFLQDFENLTSRWTNLHQEKKTQKQKALLRATKFIHEMNVATNILNANSNLGN